MARFVVDKSRVNFSIVPKGKEYNLRVLQRANTIFSTLLNLLPSNYMSAVQGPNYTIELKAVAVELAKIELTLEDIDLDRDFNRTRAEFLYSTIGYLVFLNGRIPSLGFDDEEFRQFILNLIRIYFQGSVPAAIRDAAGLFLAEDFTVFENFLLTRAGASGLDISDQFGFQVTVESTGAFPSEIFEIESSIRTILDIVRPAHTLFSIRYLFQDSYDPNTPSGQVIDAMRWRLASYYYEDFRSYWGGVQNVDRLGVKQNQAVTNENHSEDF